MEYGEIDCRDLVGLCIIDAIPRIRGMVKIGTMHGSGFFWIGDAEKFRGAKAQREVNKISRNLIRFAEQKVSRSEHSYAEILNSEPTLKKYVAKQRKQGLGYNKQGFDNVVEDWFKRLNHQEEIIKRNEKLRDEQIPFKSRKILECYPAISEPNTTIFIVEGTELGGFWTINEFENGVIEDDDAEE